MSKYYNPQKVMEKGKTVMGGTHAQMVQQASPKRLVFVYDTGPWKGAVDVTSQSEFDTFKAQTYLYLGYWWYAYSEQPE